MHSTTLWRPSTWIPQRMNESELQAAVIELAHLLKYRVAHFRPALTSKGWRTAVSADGAGYPDLTLVKPGRLIFAELKSRRGALSAEQAMWLEALREAGCEVHVWKPRDWQEGHIERILRQRSPGGVLAQSPIPTISGPLTQS